ncbi:MAG: phosphoglycerate dehydrogenase [Planctomycetia bacterium]|nr:phosphoglycerate dehydrogenase [Planctomycetia bacterium]
MPRIVVLDPISQDGLNLLDAAAGIEYEVICGLNGEELRKTLMEFDGAICRSGVKITAEVLEGNTRLKAIARAGVGTDNIDKNMATRQGIIVMNTPGGNTISTAEHALALMLGLSRNIAPANQSLIEGRWDRKLFMGTQLAGKTLGIIGLGRIGRAIAVRARAMEMKLVGYDPFLSDNLAAEMGIKMYDSYRKMLPFCDYLTVHTPLTDETRGMISTAEIAMLPKGARLINCARGGIYDEAALLEGLKSGHLGGVALDVFPNEPCKENPLFGMPNVLCTPHLGASTEEAQTNVALEAVELLIDYFTTGTIKSAVNMIPLDGRTLAEMSGYLNLAWRLGLLAAQMEKGRIAKCSICYRGEIASKVTSLVSSAFTAGLLTKATGGEANIINAKMLLKERGIELVEQKSNDKSAFSSLISVELSSENESILLGGTIFGNSMPRLVHVNDYRLEAYLDGNLCIFTHDDMPGVIGRIGNVFGRYDVNIAQLCVGRPSCRSKGKSLGVLGLDSQPPLPAITDFQKVDGVVKVVFASLPGAHELPEWLK